MEAVGVVVEERIEIHDKASLHGTRSDQGLLGGSQECNTEIEELCDAQQQSGSSHCAVCDQTQSHEWQRAADEHTPRGEEYKHSRRRDDPHINKAITQIEYKSPRRTIMEERHADRRVSELQQTNSGIAERGC